MLSDKLPLTQSEFNQLIVDFELDKRIILTYGGIDEKFLKNYLLRKNIKGGEKLKFYDFKHDVISSKYSKVNVSKDNLCRVYGINGINDIHNSLNDCVLEWELFKKMDGNKLIIINNDVYEFNYDYIIPASYLQNFPNFKYCINLPDINYEKIHIKNFKIKPKRLEKFDNNINGIMIENLIYNLLNVENKNSELLLFQMNNKLKLKKIGFLPSDIHNIPVFFNEDGTFIAINNEDKKDVKRINEVSLAIKEEMNPLIDYIKKQIFKNETIICQELVINKKDNVMAKCDLSSSKLILEIKGFNSKIDDFKYQLYYEADNRDIYLLETFWNLKNELNFIIYKIISVECNKNGNDLKSRIARFEQKIGNNDIQVINYNGYRKPVTLKCKKCFNEWEVGYEKILKHNQCPFCNQNENNTKTKELKNVTILSRKNTIEDRINNYKNKVTIKSNGSIQIFNYTGSKNNIEARCLMCGYQWSCRADHLLERCKCPNCNMKNIN